MESTLYTADSSTNGTLLSNTSSHHIINEYLWKYVGISILVIGTIGHVLSIITVLSSRILRTKSSAVYIIAMSITGIIALYFGLLRYILYIGINSWKTDIRETSTTICKLHMTTTYAALQYFAWLQGTVAIVRLISVKWPFTYMSKRKWKITVVVILGELVVITGMNIPLAVDVHLDEEGHCTPNNDFFYKKVWSYVDLANYSLVPAFVIIVSNSSILWVLNQTDSNTGSRNESVSSSLTTMLMSLNVMFVITTLPISVMAFLEWGEPKVDDRYMRTEICWTAFSLMQYAGSAGTFFIYCITGSLFREELKKLFERCCLCLTLRPANKTQASKTLPHKKLYDNTDYNALDAHVQVHARKNTVDTAMTACV